MRNNTARLRLTLLEVTCISDISLGPQFPSQAMAERGHCGKSYPKRLEKGCFMLGFCGIPRLETYSYREAQLSAATH